MKEVRGTRKRNPEWGVLEYNGIIGPIALERKGCAGPRFRDWRNAQPTHFTWKRLWQTAFAQFDLSPKWDSANVAVFATHTL